MRIADASYIVSSEYTPSTNIMPIIVRIPEIGELINVYYS